VNDATLKAIEERN